MSFLNLLSFNSAFSIFKALLSAFKLSFSLSSLSIFASNFSIFCCKFLQSSKRFTSLLLYDYLFRSPCPPYSATPLNGYVGFQIEEPAQDGEILNLYHCTTHHSAVAV